MDAANFAICTWALFCGAALVGALACSLLMPEDKTN